LEDELSKLGRSGKVTFDELFEEMVAADLDTAKRDAMIAKKGYKVYSHHE